MRFTKRLFAVAVGALFVGVAQGSSVSSIMNGQVMFGIQRSTGKLVHYDFGTQQTTTLGTVKDSSGTAMTNLDAAVYFPGFKNVFALWENPQDHKNKLIYINLETAVASVVATDVEGGHFTGATGVATSTNAYALFAIQAAKVKPPSTITGTANINPNNNNDNEFSLTKGDGSKITREDLKDNSPVAADGTYYQGSATFFHLKPKGNGNQNGLIIDGAAYALQNSNTYDFSGDMQVRLYNDKVNGNLKATGHWWLQVISGTVTINNDVQVLTPNRIAQVDQKTGTVTELMPLTQTYTGLATGDGKVFYTTKGADLYKIDTTTLTETKVGTMPSISLVYGMEFVGPNLMVYDNPTMSLTPINTSNGAPLATPVSPGTGDLAPSQFTPKDKDGSASVGQYD